MGFQWRLQRNSILFQKLKMQFLHPKYTICIPNNSLEKIYSNLRRSPPKNRRRCNWSGKQFYNRDKKYYVRKLAIWRKCFKWGWCPRCCSYKGCRDKRLIFWRRGYKSNRTFIIIQRSYAILATKNENICSGLLQFASKIIRFYKSKILKKGK